MSTGFEGTPAQFTDAERRVTDVRVGMDQNIMTLADRIEATRAGWVGEAARAFDNIMRRFHDSATSMNKELQNIAELLEQAGSKYERSEQQQQEIMKAVNKGFDVLHP
ncbi:WXG100 family type VII secretion target [Amycolatopsis sp. NPDC051061]|uniref:WXG100 family type VII secretion target n=1 Tax=Amycolatopsis sp. NPDC051061 TaxID=3155042 RepID=UPI003420D3AF